jgi:hypothetical protein
LFQLQKGISFLFKQGKESPCDCQAITLLLSLKWEIAWLPLGDFPFIVE